MEKVVFFCVENYLEEGYIMVGSKVDILYLVFILKGMKVKVVVQLIVIEDRKLIFKVEVYDSFEKIGEGVYERFIVNCERFLNKVY